MAIFFMDSCDHYDANSLSDKYNVSQVQIGAAGSGRDGVGRSVGTGLSGELIFSSGNTRYTEAVMSFAGSGSYTVVGSLTWSMQCVLPGPVSYGIATLIVDSVGDICFSYAPSTGGGTRVSAFATRKWPTNEWIHASFKIIQTTTTCRGILYLNEQSVLDETLSGWSAETYIGVNRFKINRGLNVDDYYITDGDVLGDLEIGVIHPDGDDSVAWSRLSGGSNYLMVNEIQADRDTTYNYASTATTKDIFTMQDIDTAVVVHACQSVMLSRKTDVGGASLKVIWKPTTVEYSDADFYPSLTSYTWNRTVRVVNPDTGIAWTPAEVNALKMGYEKVL